MSDKIQPWQLDTSKLVKKGSDALDFLKQSNSMQAMIGGVQEGLVLLLDVSGSMASTVDPDQGNYHNKCDAMKEAAEKLIMASTASWVGLVAFNTTSDTLCRVSERNQALGALSQLQPTGGTRIVPGMKLAHEEINRCRMNLNRVIIMSDGCAAESRDEILALANLMKADGIIIDTVAFGMDADEALLKAIATQGNGVYKLAGSANELVKTFLQLEAKKRGLLTGKKR